MYVPNLDSVAECQDHKTKETKFLMQGVSGIVKPGEVLAVLGPSGSGKSTLLDVLAGRKRQGTVHGTVALNGTDLPIKKYSSYVTKDDSLQGSFTVRETLKWAVELNTSGRTCPRILSQFGLTKCADSKVGDLFARGISGGEKRRLSVAVQLVKEPNVIFIDEPTSGLDSAASFKMMESIKDLAVRKGCAIICTVHQPSPSSYDLFDKVLFLARGHVMYFGPNKGAEVDYFLSIGVDIPEYTVYINVDFVTDVSVADARVDNLIQKWAQSKNFKTLTTDMDTSTFEVNSAASQIIRGGSDYTLSWKPSPSLVRRSLSTLVQNVLYFWIRLGFMIAMAVLMGTTWLRMGYNQDTVQDRFSGIFFAIGFNTYLAVIGAPAFLEERAVFYRERMNRTYSVGAFTVAHTIVSVPITFVNTLAYSIIAYWLMGYNSGTVQFFRYFAFLFLTLIIAEAFMLILAAAFPIFLLVLLFFSFFNGTEMVVAGFFVRQQNIPNFWKYGFHYWDFQKWSFEALSANEFSGTVFDCAPGTNGSACNCYIPSSLGDGACTFTGEDILANYGYDTYSYWKSG
ncbi:P-loop containing nucleoside triphosphate hydrolase protein [Rhizoclosmatium globosum]|uniref:p-loop containing nucleoside triphosphate hydrolase protein n=1 Tax=Rhizoclosmatium globosum TaxID=329046 RepID=A0A1Y2B3U2_9FUNG|nr:P-loop containing nucleoside triphosphate hydrolase protein [Rhizoclosmatium globosum]|eukprot:ORY29491.1 P-loop containing nucleoside triphosphate hydrolase protein [Rhizoclosmatium globosum]